MSDSTTTEAERFRLDPARLAAHVIASEDELSGIDEEHEGGLAAAIAGRFRQAEEAGAICGPSDVEVVVSAIHGDGLIVAVRERIPSGAAADPLRQVASYSLDAGDVACPLDHSFDECCAAITHLLVEANGLLPALAALRPEPGEDPVTYTLRWLARIVADANTTAAKVAKAPAGFGSEPAVAGDSERPYRAICVALFPDGTASATLAEARALSLTGVLSEIGERLEASSLDPRADALDLTVSWPGAQKGRV